MQHEVDLLALSLHPVDFSKLHDKDFDFTQLDGKVVVLDFWGTWCTPCRKQMPEYNKLYKKYRDRGVVFVGVNFHDKREEAEKFLHQANIEFPVAYDADLTFIQAMNVSSAPTSIVLDHNHRVEDIFHGYGTGHQPLVASLDRLLK